MPSNADNDIGGQYRILRELGKGSSAVVYLAEKLDNNDKNLKAIKCFDVDSVEEPEKRQMLDEATLLSEMKHPYILQFYDSFFEGNKFYIVTEHCKGGDLARFLRDLKDNGRHLEEDQIGKWTVQLLLAITFIHNNKVLHRDLKTSNIFLQEEDIRVGDFGICRILNSTHDLATTFVGTPYYMSPEVLTNNTYNNKSDIWSLGVIIYEICTQKRAFNGTSLVRVMWQVVKDPSPTIPESYSKDLQSLVQVMLTKDPKVRPSAASLLRHPFVQRHLRQMIKRDWLFRTTDSASLQDQMETIQKMWLFPDGFFSTEQLSLKTELEPSPMDEVDPAVDEEQQEEVEIDLATLTPRQRIQMNLHTESDVLAAELRQKAVRFMRGPHNKSKGSESVQNSILNDGTVTGSGISVWRSPEELMLNELRQLGKEFGQRAKDDNTEDDDDELSWPYSTINDSETFERLTYMNMFGSDAADAMPITITSPNESANKNDIQENDQHTVAPQTPAHPPPWKTYVNLLPDESINQRNQTKEEADIARPKTRYESTKTNVSDRLFYSRSFSNSVNKKQCAKQTAGDTIYELESGGITFTDTSLTSAPWDETELEETIYPKYPLQETMAIRQTVTDRTHGTDVIKSKTTSDATIATEQLNSPVMEFSTITGDTVQQVIQCMKTALQSEKEDDLFCSDEDTRTTPTLQKARSRQDELVGMKHYCIQKMGKRIFDMAHDYLYRERIVERNAAGELSILTGLREICRDVTAGFVLDQLLFLEHADVQQETDSIKSTQNTRLPASIDAIILQSIT